MAAAIAVPDRGDRWPRMPQADMRHALPLCAALSLGVHLLMLSVRVPSEMPRQATQVSAGAPRTMQARLVAGTASLPSEPAGTADAGAGERTVMAESSSIIAAHRPSSRPASLPEPQGPVEGTEPVAHPSQAPAESIFPAFATPRSIEEHDDYIPRPLLSVAPVVRAPVVIGSPADETEVGRHVGILSLFIDEEGRVRHISASEPLLPPAFEQAAREAFIAAQFSPGQVDGLAVKSRVRVEVVFDNTPLVGR